MSCLDLVVTVDTSMAHLAGGDGVSDLDSLPYTPDYRWLLDRDDQSLVSDRAAVQAG